MIVEFKKNYAESTKKLVLLVLSEFGYEYDTDLDLDLEDIEKYYSVINKSIFLVYLNNEDVIGTIALKNINDSTCELKRFYVNSDFRKKGVGKMLFREFIKYAQKFNYKKIILDTTEIMTAAIKFYEKCGFKQISKNGEIIYYEANVPEAIFQKRPSIGVSVILIHKKNLLLGLRKVSHGANTWGMPGGHIEWGESFYDCAKREIKEELGVKISCNLSPFHVTNDFLKKENKHYVTVFVVAYIQEDKIKNNEPEKCSEWKWFNHLKLPQNLFLPVKNLITQKKLGVLFTE
jgi:8-oxo-dGTP diphosphatase